MNTVKAVGLVGVAVAALFSTQAFATTCSTAPATGTQTQGGPTCIAPSGLDGAGNGLQDKLDSITRSGPKIDVYHGQAPSSSYFSIGATGSSENAFVFAIAGNAGTNSFGIYDPNNKDNYLMLFGGGAQPGASTKLQNLGNGKYVATYFNADGSLNMTLGASATPGQQHVTFGGGNLVGYYLDSQQYGFFYSDPSLNVGTDQAGNPYANGMRQMAAYAGNNQTEICIKPTACGLFQSGEYILAWEDLPFTRSDLDYNDLVVMVESVHPVPEPGALGMFGLGLLAVIAGAGLRRRRAYQA